MRICFGYGVFGHMQNVTAVYQRQRQQQQPQHQQHTSFIYMEPTDATIHCSMFNPISCSYSLPFHCSPCMFVRLCVLCIFQFSRAIENNISEDCALLIIIAGNKEKWWKCYRDAVHHKIPPRNAGINNMLHDLAKYVPMTINNECVIGATVQATKWWILFAISYVYMHLPIRYFDLFTLLTFICFLIYLFTAPTILLCRNSQCSSLLFMCKCVNKTTALKWSQ